MRFFSFYSKSHVLENVVYNQTAAGEPLMQLVAVDWLKDIKRIDHVAKRKGCVAQVRIHVWYQLETRNLVILSSIHMLILESQEFFCS